METKEWKALIENKCKELKNLLITSQDFNKMISDIIEDAQSIILGLTYEIETYPGFKFKFGQTYRGDPTATQTVKLNNCDCNIKIWNKPDYIGAQVFIDAEMLFKCFWKPEYRDSFSNLLDLKNEDLKKLCNNTVAYYNYSVAIFFCDLDKFKQVNEKHGQNEGDRVIKEFGQIIHSISNNIAVPLHRSGDEYAIILPLDAPHKALILANKILTATKNYDFRIEVPVGVSSGIIVNHSHTSKSFWDFLSEAEKVLKPSEGNKQRGTARIKVYSSAKFKAETENSLESCFCKCKSNICNSAPFSNVWLNLISFFVSFLKIEKIKDNICSLIEWIKPNFDSNLKKSSDINIVNDCEPMFSELDVAFAIFHGLSRNKEFKDKTCLIKHSKNFNALQLIADDILIYSTSNQNDIKNNFHCGKICDLSNVKDINTSWSKRAILLSIGIENQNTYCSIFADTIVIDDRPTIGGGLPDFWEAAIARIVNIINMNPNITELFVLGNKNNGSKTIDLLRTINEWDKDLERLSKRTKLSIGQISNTAKKLAKHIHFPNNATEIYKILTETLVSNNTYHKNLLPSEMSHPKIKRNLDYEIVKLKISDGCRVDTIAEAYPTVLEIIRSSIDGDLIIDQAQKESKELVDFKICINNPQKDLIPNHYRDEEEKMKEYFEKEFIIKGGRFYDSLNKDLQLECVINHIVETMKNSKSTTRRATLVLPHIIEKKDNISPLGLTSIRIIPRYCEDIIVLNFSFTWRTVEAIIGFPFSIYASAKYGEYLTSEISKRLPEKAIKFDKLFYIAHSLHLFQDDNSLNIVRGIVNDESY